jgi:hypothetical protein
MENMKDKVLADLFDTRDIMEKVLADLSAAKVENVKEERHISSSFDLSLIEGIKDLPPHILEEFEKTGFVAHVLKYADRHEIRYCRNGYSIRATHSDLRQAEELFLEEAKRKASNTWV